MRRITDLLVLLGIYLHSSTYANANGGFSHLYDELLRHNPNYQVHQLVIYLIAFAGPYLLVLLGRYISKTVIGVAVAFMAVSFMLGLTAIIFFKETNSASLQWAVVLLPVILYPFSFLMFILTLLLESSVNKNSAKNHGQQNGG